MGGDGCIHLKLENKIGVDDCDVIRIKPVKENLVSLRK